MMTIAPVLAFIDPVSIGLVLTAVGGGVSLFGANQKAKAEKRFNNASNQINKQNAILSQEISAESLDQERIRKDQATLDYRRMRREIIRRSQLARSVSLSRGAAQGASFGSGVAGGQAQIANELNYNLNSLDQNFELGMQSFENNKDIFNLQSQVSSNQSRLNQLGYQFKNDSLRSQNISNVGGLVSQIGGTVLNNAGTIDRVGLSLFGGYDKTQWSNTTTTVG